MKQQLVIFLSFLCSLSVLGQTSPNGKVRASYVEGKGILIAYKSQQGWQPILSMPTEYSHLTTTTKQKVKYDMQLGKKSHCSNAFVTGVYSKSGVVDQDVLLVNVYNDGVTFDGPLLHTYKVDFSTAKNNWIQKWSEGYEDFFPKNREQKRDERYGYPALFEYDGDVWALISESRMTDDMAATSMWATDTAGVFNLRPDGPERGGSQTVIIGSLADVVESTLITDNSEPCQLTKGDDLSSLDWIRPGVAAWVYWAYNHGSNDYNIIKRYTDMAVRMHLPYVLIDAEWDNFLPPYTVEDALRYATSQGVSPIIWYSSSIGWLDGAPGPKFRLNKPEDREREFAWCEKMGIKGVKIDFFSGDTHQNIKFMIELLQSAARHHLLVNFHGSAIPRGWQRTYPNLVSTEAVYGAEWYNNKGVMTHKAASHNATLPFTRNVIGSMDYTPCAFTDSQHPHITTHAHELALTALFESGIQHLADRPESFLAQPQAVQDYLSQLPTAWDETRLLGGYPGDYVILARRKGTVWYIAGINGNDTPQKVSIPTQRLKHLGKNILLLTDSGDAAQPWRIEALDAIPSELTLLPRGGFVMVIRR